MSSQTTNMMPCDLEVERTLLGMFIVDSRSMAGVADVIEPKHFYLDAHQHIYKICKDLFLDSRPIDKLEILTRLKDADILEKVGGKQIIDDLISYGFFTENIENHATTLISKYVLRETIAAGKKIIEIGRSLTDAEVAIDAAEKETFALRSLVSFKSYSSSLEECAIEAYDQIQLRLNNDMPAAISTGYRDLDGLLNGGFRPGELIVVGARPGMGKSAFMANIALNVSQMLNMQTLIFSLEMSRVEITNRYFARESNVSIGQVKSSEMHPKNLEKVASLLPLFTYPMVINDDPYITIGKIKSEVRKLVAGKKRTGLVAVDYLQLMADSSNTSEMVHKVGTITRGLKLLARECNVPIMLLSQLNRASEARNDKKPQLSDLRDSGNIEQDANIVLFPYRESYHNKDAPSNVLEIIVAKNRDGKTDSVKLLFEGEISKISNTSDRQYI